MNAMRYLFKPKIVLSAIAAVAIGMLTYGTVVSNNAKAADCNSNAVIWCGYTNPTNLINKLNNGEARADVKTILAHDFTGTGFGLKAGDYDRFAKTAQHGRAYKNGELKLDNGNIIAKNGASLGREGGRWNPNTINIGGTTYHWGYNSTAFETDGLGFYAIFNQDDHSLQFASQTDCANPIWGQTAGYKCTMLNKTAVAGTTDTFNFTTNVYTRNSSVKHVVYEFGDGTNSGPITDPNQVVSHKYAPGNWTAKVTVYFNVYNWVGQDTRAECTKPVEVKEAPKPVFVCKNLAFTQIGKPEDRTYTFTVTAEGKNGPKFVKADFNFGDGQTQNGVTANGTTATSAAHKFAKDLSGDITIKAKVYADTGATSEGAACTRVINFEKMKECKPGIPEGDVRCTEYCKPGIPVNDERCTPKEIPSTGPAEVIGSAIGLGGLVAAGTYYRNSRRNFIATFFKR